MKPHTAVGIATVIFYAPITLYAQYIGIRCWKYGSRMACYMVMVFTLSTSSVSFLARISCSVD
jgi:membrane-associated PAP2 superfamily phosphatase